MLRFVFLVLFLGTGFLSHGQPKKTVDYSLIYDFSYIRDTVANEYSRPYKCIAIRAGEEGRFRDNNAHFNDSIIATFSEQYPGLSTASLPKKKLDEVLAELDETMAKWQKPTTEKFRIIKDFAKCHSRMVLTYGMTPQHLEQPIVQKWELTSVQDTIEGMRCYQAKTRYGGRSYVAWYNPDIPISDGPYVFTGLPGLIVKISDEKSWYVFTIKQMNLQAHERFWDEYFMLSVSVPVSRGVFVQTMAKRKENPRIPGIVGKEPEEIRLRRKNGFKKRFDLLLERNE